MDLQILATDILSRGYPCLKKSSRFDYCEEIAFMRKKFKCAVSLRCRRQTTSAFDSRASSREFDSWLDE